MCNPLPALALAEARSVFINKIIGTKILEQFKQKEETSQKQLLPGVFKDRPITQNSRQTLLLLLLLCMYVMLVQPHGFAKILFCILLKVIGLQSSKTKTANNFRKKYV